MTYSVAVSGASGYAGGEILRLLADHPEFEVRTVTAHANAGQPLVAVQPHLRTYTHLTLKETTAETLAGHDVVFLALPHGTSGAIAAQLPDETLVIDCGADHRLESADDWAEFYGGDFHSAWTYGVPELPRLLGHAARPARQDAAHRRSRLQRLDGLALARSGHPGRRHRGSRPRHGARRRPVGRGQEPEGAPARRPRSSARRIPTRSAACTGTSPRSCRHCGGRGLRRRPSRSRR